MVWRVQKRSNPSERGKPQEATNVRRMFRYLRFVLLLVCVPLAHAQNSFDVGLGFGTFRDKATGAGIDTNSFASCTPATDATCQLTPSLGSVFMGFQGDAMLNKHFGF